MEEIYFLKTKLNDELKIGKSFSETPFKGRNTLQRVFYLLSNAGSIQQPATKRTGGNKPPNTRYSSKSTRGDQLHGILVESDGHPEGRIQKPKDWKDHIDRQQEQIRPKHR